MKTNFVLLTSLIVLAPMSLAACIGASAPGIASNAGSTSNTTQPPREGNLSETSVGASSTSDSPITQPTALSAANIAAALATVDVLATQQAESTSAAAGSTPVALQPGPASTTAP